VFRNILRILRYVSYVTYIMELNPFLISGYISPEYFCNREKETGIILEAVLNKRHMTVISPRRMGKTGLIRHLFYAGSKRKLFIPVYIDILATTSIREFTEVFGRGVLSALARNESGMKKILKSLASLRPRISIDSMTGAPNVTLTVENEKEAVMSLELIFNYIGKQKQNLVIAIDEFQQVTYYPEKNTEAILRTQVQQSSNVTIVFSGSRTHLLSRIFMSADRPFYNSTQILELKKIEENTYRKFIADKFKKGGKEISGEAISRVFDLTNLHTFYVQFLCNRLYSSASVTGLTQADEMILRIINENEPIYATYLSLLTPLQFKVLRAIALNSEVTSPSSNEFLTRYDLGAASSVSQTIKSLEEKELITWSEKKLTLNDQFFMQWLKRK